MQTDATRRDRPATRRDLAHERGIGERGLDAGAAGDDERVEVAADVGERPRRA